MNRLAEIGTFILDFQTINFDPDAKIAHDFLSSLQDKCQLANSYALDEPLNRAGWSFAKVFLAGQFVERIYDRNKAEIDSTKGKKFEDKFIGWFAGQLKKQGCGANLKMAPEMKSLF